ncbi:MAG: GTPase, partial [Eubacteriaceae bacterium]
MSLNSTPSSNRVHIAFFGKTNVGKSSLINSVTNQNIAIVSPVKGTTTDPVYKAMELLPIGPIMMIDTAGLSDTSK